MFFRFLYPLTSTIPLFNIFQYITFRAAYAAITALLVCFLLGPAFIRLLNRNAAGEKIRADIPERHAHKTGIPTMGGVLIIIAIVFSILLWMDVGQSEIWIAIFALIGFGLIGFIDDYFKTYRAGSEGLSTGVKFALQVVMAVAVALIIYARRTELTTLLYVPFLKTAVLDLGLYFIPFAVLLLLSTSNAVNLTDGLDGLATGLVLMVVLTFGVLAYVTGRVDYSEYLLIPFVAHGGELAIFCFAIAGACVGFLWFNVHPAEIFMGDTGSLSLGAAVGTIALLIKKELLLIVCGAVFVIEALSVILQVLYYKSTKKRLFRMAPLHHHFELLGWPESKIVLRLWILGGLFAIISLSTIKIQ